MLQALVLLSGCIALTFAQTPNDQCFWRNSGGTVAESTDGWHVCNNTKTTEKGASLCCLNGSQCGEDSICHFPGGSQGGTGWYLGGCTDGSYNDPVCPKACTKFRQTYIQYNNTEQLWHCCGEDDCGQPNTPANESFQAVAQREWTALPSTVTSTASTATATATATKASGATTHTGNANSNNGGNKNGGNDNSGGGLSTGAQAGIGVGVAVGCIAVFSAFAFWLLRRRRNNAAKGDSEIQGMMEPKYHHSRENSAAPAYPGGQEPKDHKNIEMPSERRVELGAGLQSPQELGATQEPSELPGDGTRR